MKKFLIPVTVAVIATCLVTGCAGGVLTYDDPEQPINTSVNQEFIIALGANPTTGYDWEEGFDKTMLKLVDKTYKTAEEAEHEVIGAGGIDYFRFKALKKGTTEITMVYKRSWEEESAEQRVFTVNIK